MSEPASIVERAAGVASITLNRPAGLCPHCRSSRSKDMYAGALPRFRPEVSA